ncbi:MAG: beta-ketoacyl synthase N-terminal-like domain-containing protein [Thermodesulfobacteriota bacterium]|nr:beta-ketoacyl synthase N-terminal-like domain-containing protein [Thermodesulfobacteriota bacterium]
MKISIKGIGVLGGFGCGISAFNKALIAGKSSSATKVIKTTYGNIEVPAFLANTDSLKSFVNKRDLRRIDHYIRMALLGCFLALEDADLLHAKRGKMGIIIATGYGSTCNTFDLQNSVITEAAPFCSPIQFSNSVHNAAATYISILLKEMGPNLSVSHYDMSIASAFLTACQWLKEKRVDSVLVGSVDEYNKILGYFWYCLYNKGNKKAGFAGKMNLEHAIIGEGANFFVLAGEKEATSPYGFIEDVKMGNFNLREINLPENAAFFLGADGYSECDEQYADYIPEKALVASYSHLYGGLPVGTGFDIAIAALSNKSKTVFKSGNSPIYSSGRLNVIRHNENLGSRRICCLKLGAGGSYGWVSLHQ